MHIRSCVEIVLKWINTCKKSMRDEARKTISKVLRQKAEETFTEFYNCPNVFIFVRQLKIYDNEVDGGRCM